MALNYLGNDYGDEAGGGQGFPGGGNDYGGELAGPAGASPLAQPGFLENLKGALLRASAMGGGAAGMAAAVSPGFYNGVSKTKGGQNGGSGLLSKFGSSAAGGSGSF